MKGNSGSTWGIWEKENGYRIPKEIISVPPSKKEEGKKKTLKKYQQNS